MHEKFEAYGNFSLVPKMDLNSKGFYPSPNHIGLKQTKISSHWVAYAVWHKYTIWHIENNIFAELNLSFLNINLALKTFGSNFVSFRVYWIAPLGRFLIKAKKNVHRDL